MRERDTAELVALAGAGDQDAWRELVDRYAGLVWTVARSFRLEPADAADVSQTTWLVLAESLATLREPARLAGWLITTARREALRVAAVRGREAPAEWWTPPATGTSDDPEDRAVRADRAGALWRAFVRLPERCQQILRYLAYAPELTYVQVARAVGIPVGSLGPTRARCLAELRRKVVAAGLVEEVAG